MAERKPPSRLGRALADWGQAFLFFAGLPPEVRCYRLVADEFGVSVRTVERHGRAERWWERARELDRAAAAQAAERLRERRVERLLDVEKLIEASHVTYATQLRDGKVRISPADLPRLHKLRTDLWAEIDADAVEPTAPELEQPVDSTERKLEVLRALREVGALDTLLHPDGAESPAVVDDDQAGDQTDQGGSDPSEGATAR